MSSIRIRPPAFHSLMWSIVIAVIIADQLSKAYFVYLLGSHSAKSFTDFLLPYFSIFEPADGIRANYSVFKPSIPVWDPWLNWTLTTNTGAAWSIFRGKSFYLSFVSIVMAAGLFLVWWRSFRHNRAMTWALGGIVGGALGNFLDRFRLKEVVDFIDVKLPLIGRIFKGLGDPYDFPIFNIADAAAVCGTIALAIYLISADIRGFRNRSRAPAQPKLVPFPEGLQMDDAAVEQLHLKAQAQHEALARMHENDASRGGEWVEAHSSEAEPTWPESEHHGLAEPDSTDDGSGEDDAHKLP